MISKSAMPGDAGQESEESELQNLGFFFGIGEENRGFGFGNVRFFREKNSSW